MKQNSLLLTRTERASSTDELVYLHHQLKGVASPRKRLLKAILNVLVLWGATLLGLLFASGVLSYFASNNEQVTFLLSLPRLQEIAIISSAIFAFISTYRWLKAWDNPYPAFLKDVNNKTVIDETYVIQDVYCFQEPKLGGCIYFLKVSEKNSFVIYDYQSQIEGAVPLKVKQQIKLTLASHSKQVICCTLRGADGPAPTTYPLTTAPENWPRPDSWLTTPWAELVSVYSQK